MKESNAQIGKKLSIEVVLRKVQVLKLLEKDFKATIISLFKEHKVTMLK